MTGPDGKAAKTTGWAALAGLASTMTGHERAPNWRVVCRDGRRAIVPRSVDLPAMPERARAYDTTCPCGGPHVVEEAFA